MEASALKVWRRLGISFSLANIFYIRAWSEVLTYSPADTFFMASPPPPQKYLALIISVFVLSGVLFAATTFMNHVKGLVAAIGRWVFLMSLLIPLNGFREVLSQRERLLRADVFRVVPPYAVAIVLLLGALTVIFCISRWEHQVVRIASQLLLLCLPLIAMYFGQAIYAMAHYEPQPFANRPCVAPLPARAGQPRFVVMVFDEWDYRLTFVDRVGTLKMPETDRLRRQTIFATHAHSPSAATIQSIPALLTGRLVQGTYPGGVSELSMKFKDRPEIVRFADAPNIFSEARAAGFNTGLIGWYLPYCRMLNGSLTYCDWAEMARQFNTTGTTLAENLVNQTRGLFETSLFSLFGQSLVIQGRIKHYQSVLANAKAEVADPDVGLLFLHFGIPHPPYFYNRQTGRFDLKNSAVRGYWDNLALMDRTLGELRRAMEAANLWDNSTVLITSDHYFRTAAALDRKMDFRVPFLLKLAGSDEAIDISTPFNTILVHDLVSEVLGKRIVTAQQASDWIKARAARQPADMIRKGASSPSVPEE
jgi:hypothetical protein